MRIFSIGLATVMVASLSGCMFFDDSPDPATALRAKNAAAQPAPAPPPAEVAPAAPAPKPLGDAEILGFLKTANASELAFAAAAKKLGAKGDVKTYASMLATTHDAAAKKEQDLEKKSSLRADESAADAASLKSDADAMVAKLADAKGKDLDKAFIDGQVAVHQQMVDAIDTKLAPAAQNDDVKGYVTSMRASLADHLAKAQDLQKKMNATAAVPAASASKKAKK